MSAMPSWGPHTAGSPHRLRYRCDEHGLSGLSEPCPLAHERTAEVWASTVETGPVAVAVSSSHAGAWDLGEAIAAALSRAQRGVYRVTAMADTGVAYYRAGRKLDPAEVDALAREEARRG